MAETLLSKHEKTVKQMKTLLEGIQGSQEGSLGDKSQAEFQYNAFADKWRRTKRDKEYGALLKSLGIKTNLRTAFLKDPKKLYVQLNKKRIELEAAMGTKYKKDLKGRWGEGIFTGMSSGSLLSSNINPDYVRGYDPKIKALHIAESKRTKSDYLRSSDQSDPTFDADGWKLLLSEDNPDRKLRVRDQVYNIKGTQFAGTPGVDGGPPKMTPGTIRDQAWGHPVDTSEPKQDLKVSRKRNSRSNKYEGLTINGKAPSKIQERLIDAGFSTDELETLIENDRKWRANRRR